MSTLSVRVATPNPGNVYVRVWTYRLPGPRFEWSGVVTSASPLDQNWDDLEPGHYAVTISWAEGAHDIGSDNRQNRIIYNGDDLHYHVTGRAAPNNQVIATFSVTL